MIAVGDVLREKKTGRMWAVTGATSKHGGEFVYIQQPGTVALPVSRTWLEARRLEVVTGSERAEYLKRFES